MINMVLIVGETPKAPKLVHRDCGELAGPLHSSRLPIPWQGDSCVAGSNLDGELSSRRYSRRTFFTLEKKC